MAPLPLLHLQFGELQPPQALWLRGILREPRLQQPKVGLVSVGHKLQANVVLNTMHVALLSYATAASAINSVGSYLSLAAADGVCDRPPTAACACCICTTVSMCVAG